MTGYPSIDKPWLRYYSEETINAPLHQNTMHGYIWENNKNGLSDNAFFYFGTKITFGSFFENVKKVARSMAAYGVKEGDIVTVMSMHTPETVYVIYGLNFIGAVANLVYMTLSEQEILKTLHQTNSKLIFILDPAIERIEKIKSDIKIPIVVSFVSDSMPLHLKTVYALKNAKSNKVAQRTGFVSYRQFLKKGEDANEPIQTVDHGAMAVIVYTSGTTGEPKGVCLSNDNMNAIVDGLKKTDRNYQRNDRALLIIPPFVGFGISMLHLCIGTGMFSDLFIILNADAVGKEFTRFKTNRFVAGPPWLDGIMRHANKDMGFIIDITGGGEEIEAEKERVFNNFLKGCGSKTRYLTGYGMTEFGSVIAISMMHAYREGSVGVPLCDNSVRIEDVETRNELPYGEIGEICVSTPSLMIGYYRNEQGTAECIRHDNVDQRWMRTGDLGYVDQDGFLYVKGRIKRIYMTKGKDGVIYRLFPQRIEEVLLKSNSIRLCGVIVRKDQEKIGEATAYVELKEKSNDEAKIINSLKMLVEQELPEHMFPNDIIVIDKMPMTLSGKIDYRALESISKNQ